MFKPNPDDTHHLLVFDHPIDQSPSIQRNLVPISRTPASWGLPQTFCVRRSGVICQRSDLSPDPLPIVTRQIRNRPTCFFRIANLVTHLGPPARLSQPRPPRESRYAPRRGQCRASIPSVTRISSASSIASAQLANCCPKAFHRSMLYRLPTLLRYTQSLGTDVRDKKGGSLRPSPSFNPPKKPTYRPAPYLPADERSTMLPHTVLAR